MNQSNSGSSHRVKEAFRFAFQAVLLLVALAGCIGSVIYVVNAIGTSGWLLKVVGGIAMVSLFAKLSLIVFKELTGNSMFPEDGEGGTTDSDA
jgi:integral membrane sensor domain MASE1